MFLLILVGTFGAMLMQTSLGTAIPTLMKDFNISMSTAQQATTWFLLANGIMVPISAYLATKFPTRWLYVTAYAILLIGMFVAYSAPTSLVGLLSRTDFASHRRWDYDATHASCLSEYVSC